MGTEALSIPEALCSRLRAEPTDREGWLVLADWLTDRDDPRGPLLALEDRIEHGGLPKDQHHALRIERDERLQARRSEWLQGWVPPDDAVLDWHGGFVVGVTLYGHRAVQDFEALVAHPAGRLLASATFRYLGNGWRRLLHSPALGGISSLGLGQNGLGEVGAAIWSTLAPLDTLRSLDLSDNGLGPRGAAHLARASALRTLTSLDLSQNDLDDGGLESLLEGDPWPSLSGLQLAVNEIGDESTALLARSDAFEALERLSLPFNRIRTPGARALARASGLRALGELDLRGNAIGEPGLDLLRRSERLAGCRLRL